MRDTIIQQAYAVFHEDVAAPPKMTLRGGNDEDNYESPTPYDPIEDALSDAYIETYGPNAFPFLDPASWRHYIPPLMAYSFRCTPGLAAPASFLFSFRPPDYNPPRFAVLSAAQEAVIVAFLEELAFTDQETSLQSDAMVALEEWWWPNALYRPPAAPTPDLDAPAP